MISAQQVKELRDRTGISIAECKKALETAGGDLEQAIASLRERGVATAAKKAGRTLGAGAVAVYLHTNGTMGAMVELACETDFVGKNAAFRTLAEDLAMQVAAFNPATLEDLLAEPFVRDAGATVADLISGAVQKFGERCEIVRFARFEVGLPDTEVGA
jgi:elongation factor Ts